MSWVGWINECGKSATLEGRAGGVVGLGRCRRRCNEHVGSEKNRFAGSERMKFKSFGMPQTREPNLYNNAHPKRRATPAFPSYRIGI